MWEGLKDVNILTMRQRIYSRYSIRVAPTSLRDGGEVRLDGDFRINPRYEPIDYRNGRGNLHQYQNRSVGAGYPGYSVWTKRWCTTTSIVTIFPGIIGLKETSYPAH